MAMLNSSTAYIYVLLMLSAAVARLAAQKWPCGGETCHSKALCMIRGTTASCKCNSGYEGNGLQCQDINECDLDTNKCHSLADCINTPGSYHCMCKAGYRGNGKTCREKCPDSYILNPMTSTCLHIVKKRLNWKAAQAACRKLGEKLAVFPTVESLGWLDSFRLSGKAPREWEDKLWIGLKRDSHFGWRWQGQSKSSLSPYDCKWNAKYEQPNKSSLRTACGFLIYRQSQLWDADCSYSRYFICEKQ